MESSSKFLPFVSGQQRPDDPSRQGRLGFCDACNRTEVPVMRPEEPEDIAEREWLKQLH